ncbi:MAG: hypothetical protein KF716_23425 [Anaerolineae bacterium]|nr:hypothetical protein [Anaerolineae bacterium]
MAIKTLYLPIARRLMEWERLTGQIQPEARSTFEKEASEIEHELDQLLESGWSILAHSDVQDAIGNHIAFVLRKAGE